MAAVKKIQFRSLIKYIVILISFLTYNAEAIGNPVLIPYAVDISINDVSYSRPVIIYVDKKNHVFVSKKTIVKKNIQIIKHQPIIVSNQQYYSLSWYHGVRYQINKKYLTLKIFFPLEYLPKHHTLYTSHHLIGAIRPKEPGLYINYDMNFQHGNMVSQLSGLLDFHLFNKYGSGENNLLLKQVDQNNDSIIRLNTSWQIDRPEAITSTIIGDSITGSAIWSGAVRFGGIQYKRNYATQPNLITFPLPSFSGAAVIPTNIDVFVNNVLNHQSVASPGSYNINNIPVVNGAGQVSVVTRDLLGREQVAVIPYYASPVLLKPGLDNYSFEGGWTRNNYGLNSFDYHNFLIVGTYNRGFTDHLTLGLHGSMEFNKRTLGLTDNYLYKHFGVFTISSAISEWNSHPGWLGEIGFTRRTRHYSYGLKATYTSHDFTQIGLQSGDLSPEWTGLAFASYFSKKIGEISLSYTQLNARYNKIFSSSKNSKILTAGYSKLLFHQVHLGISGLFDLSSKHDNSYFLTISFSPSKDKILAYNGQYKKYTFSNGLQLSKALPEGNGFGYRLLANQGIQPPGEADIAWRYRAGELSGRYIRYTDSNHYELNLSGGLIYFGSQFLLTRSIDQSFGLIAIPKLPNTPIYLRNNYFAKTNKDGVLLLPDLLPYQKNKISIHPEETPLNCTISNYSRNITPYFHSGFLVKFNASCNSSVIMNLVFQGKSVPVDAKVYILPEKNHTYYTGYKGMLYLPEVYKNFIRGNVRWDGGYCTFKTKLPAKKLSVYRIGRVQCLP